MSYFEVVGKQRAPGLSGLGITFPSEMAAAIGGATASTDWQLDEKSIAAGADTGVLKFVRYGGTDKEATWSFDDVPRAEIAKFQTGGRYSPATLQALSQRSGTSSGGGPSSSGSILDTIFGGIKKATEVVMDVGPKLDPKGKIFARTAPVPVAPEKSWFDYVAPVAIGVGALVGIGLLAKGLGGSRPSTSATAANPWRSRRHRRR